MISITGFRVLSGLAAGASAPVTVHYKTGTYDGSETTPANWTTEGSYTVISGGVGTPSSLLTLNTPIVLPAGQTIGIYIEFDADYTVGTTSYTDGDFTIVNGAGLCSSFGGVNAGRIFNGTVYCFIWINRDGN